MERGPIIKRKFLIKNKQALLAKIKPIIADPNFKKGKGDCIEQVTNDHSVAVMYDDPSAFKWTNCTFNLHSALLKQGSSVIE